MEELLQAAEGRAGLILELKGKGLAAEVSKSVRLSGFTGQVIYASFLHHEVRSVREGDPRAMTLALFGRLPHDPVMAAQEARATHIGFNYSTLTKPLVETCHQRGLVVFAYTVNDPQDIMNMVSLGVDGIVSDFPDRL